MSSRKGPVKKAKTSATKLDQESIIAQLGEALCIVEVVILSLDTCERSGPELPALQCALRGLNQIHTQLLNEVER